LRFQRCHFRRHYIADTLSASSAAIDYEADAAAIFFIYAS
jgi:hypothetical protein